MPIARILIVDDDPEICRLLVRVLEGAGYSVSSFFSGNEALNAADAIAPDLVIVDLGLPDMDGLSVVAEFRRNQRCGVIILSGRSDPVERIVGLEVGADDYVSKPFEPRELLARVRSVLRRLGPAPSNGAPATDMADVSPGAVAVTGEVEYTFDGWRLKKSGRVLYRPDGKPEDLTSGEFSLLLALVEQAGRVLTRDQLMEATHGNAPPAFDRSVDVQIGRLRRKIQGDQDAPDLIRTVRNAGYVFAAHVTRA